MYLYSSSFKVVVNHKLLVSLYNDPSRLSPARVDKHRSNLLAFNYKAVYEPRSSNLCDYASHHPRSIDNINKMSELEKYDLGIEDKIEDSRFSINRVLNENITKAITLEEIT